jgi:hypothetical protein
MNKPLRFGLAAAILTTVGVVAATVIAGALTGTPEIDRANARLQLSGSLTAKGCVGEDNVDYLTYRGTWSGGETQVLPDATDYALGGPVKVSGINWTINSKTKRGVLIGTITLTKPSTTAVVTVYTGRLTLVTQGLPSAAGPAVPARGWITASIKLPDEGAAAEDFLIANTEFKISPSSAIGEFGDAAGTFSIPNYSVVTNVAPVAADGTC